MVWLGQSPGRTRGTTWAKLRARVLREEPVCRACIARGAVTEHSRSTVCDHIVPLFEGGTDDRGNLAGMCKTCHDEKTAAESARAQGKRAPRPRARIDAGGWPVGRP